MRHRIRLLVDSGVFSSWNQQKPLNLNDYIEFVKRNEPWLWNYVNFDVIPGRFGERRTPDQVSASAKESYRNLLIMKNAGLEPIPVFHQGEDFRWLETLIRDGHDYIGISTAKDLPALTQSLWLNQVFAILPSSVRTHGFGITKPAFLLTYPFHTVDSTTWALSAGYGAIYVPVFGNYLEPPRRIIMSGVRQKSNSQKARHFELLDDAIQADVRRFIQAAGLTVTQARYSPSARRQLILGYFIELTRHLSVTVHHATQLEAGFAETLMKFKMTTQLLSFFKLKDKTDDELRCYVETGIVPRTREPRPPTNRNSAAYRTFRALALERRLEMTRQL